MLGAAFKPHTDDVRDSPALNVAAALHLRGAQVVVFDPEAGATAKAMFPTLTYVDSIEDAVTDSDALLVLTEWAEFVDADPVKIHALVNTPVVIDARNCLDADAWRAAGWNFRALGRPAPAAAAVPVTTGPLRTLVGAR